jgi:hypothetical protein
MYIDDKANLPWNNKARYASMYGRKSNAFLWPQYPNDKPAYLYRRTKRGQEYKLGLASASAPFNSSSTHSCGIPKRLAKAEV